jgi:hypothetical protein
MRGACSKSSYTVYAGVVLLGSVALHIWILPAAIYILWLVSISAALLHAMEESMFFVMIALLFAFLFKVLSAVRLQWTDVCASPVLTCGATGSLAVLLVRTYYSAQVVRFGVEFTRAHALSFGTLIVPRTERSHRRFEGQVHPC